jgi:putative redox protein
MASHKVTFQNKEGHQLAARLEVPINQHPHSYAIFAHCFTCNKNLTAVKNISRALNQNGVAVLRFDFTGLGDSEGDFSETNFSSNINDLVAAADYLSEHHQPPALLIGHSLGGAAVINVADQLPSVKAVATINSPYDPAHVSHVFGDQNKEIKTSGEAEVQIGGRPFLVKRQFLEDISEQRQSKKINNLDRALLILHSPQDRIVAIENAAKIYQEARHPKSFVTLDGADHLLSNKADSYYTGQMIAGWSSRYLEIPEEDKLSSDQEVVVRLGAQGFTTDVMIRHHSLTADEPLSIGGNDYGPSPYELLSASLGACTVMTIQMYARRKKWDVQEVLVHLNHRKDYAKDMVNVEEGSSKIDYFERIVELKGNLDETQRARLLEIANKCPVHRTLHGDIVVSTRLK